MAEIDKNFTELIWKMPSHWFSEFNCGVRVMDPISYALHSAFCETYMEVDKEILLPIYNREKERYEIIISLVNFLNSIK